MTMTVKNEGYPARLACEDCGCELGGRREGEPSRAALPHIYYEGGVGFDLWTHVLDVDEPPLVINLDDGCHCHDAYLRLQHHAYDPR